MLNQGSLFVVVITDLVSHCKFVDDMTLSQTFRNPE